MSFVAPKADSLENTAWNSEAVQEDLRNHILKASALWRQPHRHQSVWRYPCFNYDINGKRKVSILQDLNWEHTSMESKPDFNESAAWPLWSIWRLWLGLPRWHWHEGVRYTNAYSIWDPTAVRTGSTTHQSSGERRGRTAIYYFRFEWGTTAIPPATRQSKHYVRCEWAPSARQVSHTNLEPERGHLGLPHRHSE